MILISHICTLFPLEGLKFGDDTYIHIQTRRSKWRLFGFRAPRTFIVLSRREVIGRRGGGRGGACVGGSTTFYCVIESERLARLLLLKLIHHLYKYFQVRTATYNFNAGSSVVFNQCFSQRNGDWCYTVKSRVRVSLRACFWHYIYILYLLTENCRVLARGVIAYISYIRLVMFIYIYYYL